MLIRFIASNFLSINEELEFTMLAESLKTHKHHVYKTGKLDLLKAAAVYGANGAGKSNLIKAIDYFKFIVGEREVSSSINHLKFKLDKVNFEKPLSFEVEFSFGKKIYKYGLSLNNTIIVDEWLYESGVTKEDKLIFTRKQAKSGKATLKLADKYVKTQSQKLLIKLMEDNLLKSNELFLGKIDNVKIKELKEVNFWFLYNLQIIFPSTKYTGLVQMFNTSERFKNFTNDLLQTFDTGVTQLDNHTISLDKYLGEEDENLKETVINQIDETGTSEIETDDGTVVAMKEGNKYVVKVIACKHTNNKGEFVDFEISDESDGTKRLLDFIPAVDMIMQNDAVVIIDEIDQSLHPVLLRSLLSKVMSDTTTKGQLIFTTHESNLLDFDIFRQDEIWFMEKDKKSGSSQLYSLCDFKPRYDLDIRKGYLKGRFGAIPFLANLEQLNWHKENV